MKEKQRIDKILESVHERIQEEVGGLIGAELTLTLSQSTVISKEEFFDQPIGKQIFAKMDIVGDIEGKGGLCVPIKDAIRLGGTLIMLPPAELDEVVTSETYDGETEDSYGEIANIIAGSYTKTFEEMFPKACRFVRKEQEILIPVKVDIASDEPIPDDHYYQVSAAMQMDDKKMGNMIMLIPAAPFGLVEQQDLKQDQNDDDSSATEDGVDAASEHSVEKISDTGVEQAESSDSAMTSNDQGDVNDTVKSETGAGATGDKNKKDVIKHKKRVDTLLETCRSKIEEEVGALLGVEVSCSRLENKIVSKEPFFFDIVSGKQVVAYLDTVGDMEDRSYLFVGLKDAIRIGCTLIMLPPNELDAAVSEEDFGDDSQDAYGEIANIIAGVYTAVFEEQYTRSIRFIKKEIEQVVPMKVDIVSDEPMPDQLYYMSCMQFAMDGTEYGNIQLLFPAGLLELEDLAVEDEEQDDISASAEIKQGETVVSGQADSTIKQSEVSPALFKDKDVLIISDSDEDRAMICEVLDSQGYSHAVLSFRENVNNCLPGTFKAVFIVARKVDEQLFGMAIKVGAACSLPVIAAGAEWTRSKVIKAVKYGVTDILLVPAEPADIEEKIANNIVKMAA